MTAQRLLVAFCSALIVHLLIILVPYLNTNSLPPQLAGTKSIQINLASTSTKILEQDLPNDTQEEIPKESPPEQEESKKNTAENEMILAETLLGHSENLPRQTEVTTPQASQVDDEAAKIATAAQVTSKTTPLYDKNPKPAYPALARKLHMQGTVILAILVLENGTVGQVTIHKMSGHKILDNSALKTVKTWRYLPAMKNGIPIPMEVQVPILFKLD